MNNIHDNRLDQPFKENEISNYRFTLKMLETLIVFPGHSKSRFRVSSLILFLEDDKADNIVANNDCIVSIDADHAFMYPAISKKFTVLGIPLNSLLL